MIRTCLALSFVWGAIVLASPVAAAPLTVFSDDFESDTLSAFPTIGGGDIGTGYTVTGALGLVANTDVEDDATSGLTLDPRAGQYLNVANDGAESGRIIAGFASQNAGTVSASFDANVVGAANGGSLRLTFMNGTGNVSGVHSGYLVTGFWLTNQAGISLPAGIDADDVVVAYHDGSVYNVLSADGGTEADGAAIDGEGLWHTVGLTQDATIGSQPQFTLNGVLLEPVPLGNTLGAIDGLEFGANGGSNGQAYVDNVRITGIPEPTTATLLLIGLGGMLARVRRQATV
jgi:hypothetical protein